MAGSKELYAMHAGFCKFKGHAEQMKAAIEREVGQEIRMIDFTH